MNFKEGIKYVCMYGICGILSLVFACVLFVFIKGTYSMIYSTVVALLMIYLVCRLRNWYSLKTEIPEYKIDNTFNVVILNLIGIYVGYVIFSIDPSGLHKLMYDLF